MFYTYVLKSQKDNELYTGSTNDLIKRLRKHNSGSVSITKFRKPFDLIYYEACLSRKDAFRREMYLKTSWGKRYIKNRIKNYLFENKVPVG